MAFCVHLLLTLCKCVFKVLNCLMGDTFTVNVLYDLTDRIIAH